MTMCEIPGEQMDKATHAPSPLDPVSALFREHFARAEGRSRKIAEAARICREVEDDDLPRDSQP
jgi:hypothetical protein